MATGGNSGDVADSRGGLCSICLEPYGGGREVKLLPCLHTFCLPCLTRLVPGSETDHTQRGNTAGEETGEKDGGGGGGSAHELTCPTCRRVIPLPPEGVVGFQSNSDMDSSSSREADPQPVPCSLCDGDHTAQDHCRQCRNSFCSPCRRAHDKLCQGGQVRALQDPSDSISAALEPSQGQVRQQLQMVEEAVKKLSAEERKLEQERDAMDHSINARYANLLHHAADARDACCRSLREACDGLTQRRHSSMAEARQAQDTLQRQLSPSQLPGPAVSRAQLRTALFLQGELQSILNRDLHSGSLLRHHMEDDPSLMTSTLQAFMGNIVQSSQASGPAQSMQPSGSLQQHCEDPHEATTADVAHPASVNDLSQKFEDLKVQVYLLQSTCTLLGNANSQLRTDHSSLQREVTRLKDKNATLTTQQATLQREVAAMKDKHAIVHQDLAVLTAEKGKACAQLTTLQTDLTSIQADLTSVHTDTSKQQTDILQLKADHGDVLEKLSGVQTDVTALHGEQSSLKTDVTALQGEQSSLKTDVTALQGEQSSLKTDVTALQGEQSSLKTDVTALQGEQSSLKTDVTAETAMQNKGKALTAAESRLHFGFTDTRVGFHAETTGRRRSSNKKTLMCDNVIIEKGGGYDPYSGVFTAPKTGIYYFLASTSPRVNDEDCAAKLAIIANRDVVGVVYCEAKAWATGHAMVSLYTGDQVRLSSYDGGEYTFGANTSFTGMLVHAEV